MSCSCDPMDCSPLCPWKFSWKECWGRLPFPSPGDLPEPGIKPESPALQADSLPSQLPGNLLEMENSGTSLEVKWIKTCASNAGGAGLTPGWKTKIPHDVRHGQKNNGEFAPDTLNQSVF